MTRMHRLSMLIAPVKTCLSVGCAGHSARALRNLESGLSPQQENHPISIKQARYFALKFSPM
jgi:hypothetical protein